MLLLTVKPLDSDAGFQVSGVYCVPLVASCSLMFEFQVPKAEKIEQ